MLRAINLHLQGRAWRISISCFRPKDPQSRIVACDAGVITVRTQWRRLLCPETLHEAEGIRGRTGGFGGCEPDALPNGESTPWGQLSMTTVIHRYEITAVSRLARQATEGRSFAVARHTATAACTPFEESVPCFNDADCGCIAEVYARRRPHSKGSATICCRADPVTATAMPARPKRGRSWRGLCARRAVGGYGCLPRGGLSTCNACPTRWLR